MDSCCIQIFKRKGAKHLANIDEEAAVFGHNFLGDGETVKMMRLINEIELSANMSPVVLEIHYCLDHMDAGREKDVPYIAAIFFHHLTVIDKKRNLTDLIFFYRVLNVQKSGKVIEYTFPRVTCLHWAEHYVALLFTGFI